MSPTKNINKEELRQKSLCQRFPSKRRIIWLSSLSFVRWCKTTHDVVLYIIAPIIAITSSDSTIPVVRNELGNTSTVEPIIVFTIANTVVTEEVWCDSRKLSSTSCASSSVKECLPLWSLADSKLEHLNYSLHSSKSTTFSNLAYATH
jgi:hypothetical protein